MLLNPRLLSRVLFNDAILEEFVLTEAYEKGFDELAKTAHAKEVLAAERKRRGFFNKDTLIGIGIGATPMAVAGCYYAARYFRAK